MDTDNKIMLKAKIQMAICCAMDACQILSKNDLLMQSTRDDLAKYAAMLSDANDALIKLD